MGNYFNGYVNFAFIKVENVEDDVYMLKLDRIIVSQLERFGKINGVYERAFLFFLLTNGRVLNFEFVFLKKEVDRFN